MSSLWETSFLSTKQGEMEIALLSSGLPSEISKVLGRRYFFAAEWGSHNQEIVGTIESIRTSDEGPLVLGVTSPTFYGKPLIGLAFVGEKWCAYIDVKEVVERCIPGQIMFI